MLQLADLIAAHVVIIGEIYEVCQSVVNSYAYTPFGMLLNESESFAQPFKYVGGLGVMAEANGYYYMRARYYDPVIGRFISEDPLGFGGGDVNLMVYAGSNPVLYSDPSGEFIFTGTAAAYIFVVAPVVARYGPVVARAARSGYARVAPAAARAGQAVMNFAGTHPGAIRATQDFISSALPGVPALSLAGAAGAAANYAYGRLTAPNQSTNSSPTQSNIFSSQNSSYNPSYSGSGGK